MIVNKNAAGFIHTKDRQRRQQFDAVYHTEGLRLSPAGRNRTLTESCGRMTRIERIFADQFLTVRKTPAYLRKKSAVIRIIRVIRVLFFAQRSSSYPQTLETLALVFSPGSVD
jgi:hypothetical protein